MQGVLKKGTKAAGTIAFLKNPITDYCRYPSSSQINPFSDLLYLFLLVWAVTISLNPVRQVREQGARHKYQLMFYDTSP